MRIKQFAITKEEDWRQLENDLLIDQNHYDLVLAFGDRFLLEDKTNFDKLKANFPSSDILISSTSGQIIRNAILEKGLVVTAIAFESTELRTARINIRDIGTSYGAGSLLIKSLPQEGLSHVFVICDGQLVNGSELVAGMNAALNFHVPITGGMAGDGSRMEKTLLGLNNYPDVGELAAIGFYGDRFKVTCGSQAGWDSFGPDRIITKSIKNVLYEVDGLNALQLYKQYLGNLSKELPGSAMLFPLLIKERGKDSPVVRTILSIDEKEQSMTFAGNVPTGAYARFMKCNVERLIEGAHNAAAEANLNIVRKPELSIMISCIGRKIVLDQLVEEEVESAFKVLNSDFNTGFYSYGEICPTLQNSASDLHNQTMTITTFSEV